MLSIFRTRSRVLFNARGVSSITAIADYENAVMERLRGIIDPGSNKSISTIGVVQVHAIFIP